jgi:archaellum biogenesis ATPase FlaH
MYLLYYTWCHTMDTFASGLLNIIFWIYAQCIYSSSDHHLIIILSFTHHLTRSDKKDITNILTFTKNSLISLPIVLISLVIIT